MSNQDKTNEELLKELQELQQELNSLKISYNKAITECKRAEEALKESKKNLQENVNDLSLLSETTSSLLELNTNDDIYNYFGEKIYQLSGADYMIETEFNKLDGSASVRQMFGLKSYFDKITKLVGMNIKHIRIPVKDLAAQMDLTLRRKIYQVEGGIYNLAVQKIPEIVCIGIEKFLGVEEIYSVGFMWGGNYYGEISMGFKKGNHLKNRTLIQSMIDQSAFALGKKYYEESLIESERRYRNIFENTGTATMIVDENTTILLANEECLNVTGYSPDQIIGTSWTKYVAPDSLEQMMQNSLLRKQNLESIPNRYEVNLIHARGEVRHTNLSIGYIPSSRQTVVSMLDITERKKSAEALLQSEENFHRSISESSLGIRIVTVDEKTIYVNKAFLDIYEFDSLEEFINTPSKNRYTPESYIQHLERKEKRKNGQEVNDYEICIIRRNLEICHVEVSRKEVLWNGVKHYQVINQDITEQKNLTADLISTKEKAEESDRLKSAFLSNMSHEIRTPMNGILGFSNLLKAPNLSGEKQQKYIEVIQKSGARMLNTINDIIDISKIESKQMPVSVSLTNINEQLDYILTFFQPEVERKGIQLLCKKPLPSNEAIIETDREKLYAILTNLVKNAIKFTSKGSVEFGCVRKGEFLEFFVKDTGMGISPRHQELIFERFRQGSELLSRDYEGSGLGLTISKAFLEMLGGKIWVESEEGKGSVFYFTIPYNVEQKEEIAPENIVLSEDKAGHRNDLKILIADDEITSEMLLTELVGKFSKELLYARNGVEAEETCRNNSDIDLVLMDAKMPQMDGYEATRKIRQFNQDVIIIAQTAFALGGDKENALKAGCNDYIPKPIDLKLLTSLLNKYFS